MIGDEFDEIITSGEFSTEISLFYDTEVIPIRGVKEQSYKRKEVDGVLTSELPRETKTLVIAESSLPSYIPETEYPNLKFLIDNEIYSTIYVIGTTTKSFLISVEDNLDTGVNDDTTGDEEIDTSAPGIVI